MTNRETDKQSCRLSFSYKYGKVRIHKGILLALGSPRFIQVLINPERKMLVFCGTDKRESECFEVPAKDYRARNGFVLNGQIFIHRLYSIMAWTPEKTYFVDGQYDANLRCVVFMLEHCRTREQKDES